VDKGQEIEVDEALASGALEVCEMKAWSTSQAFGSFDRF
jgi:hypothetical protein